MIYVFLKSDTNLDVHSITRNYFNSPINPVCSLDLGVKILVQSELPPKQGIPNYEYTQAEYLGRKNISLKTIVAMDNRHTVQVGRPEHLSKDEALIRFESLTGLRREADTRCEFHGIVNEKKFNIHNVYRISGIFTIIDAEKFAKALRYGVGSRRSYGFGLILINVF